MRAQIGFMLRLLLLLFLVVLLLLPVLVLVVMLLLLALVLVVMLLLLALVLVLLLRFCFRGLVACGLALQPVLCHQARQCRQVE